MVKGTTPTFKLILSDESVDLTQANKVYVAFRQGNCLLRKQDDDITVSANEVDVYLSQTETLSFKPGTNIEVQLNWTYADGRRACSNIIRIPVTDNLIGSVLE